MNNINIIFTRHYPCGNCNSDELHKIIQILNPEIIFEELSLSNFHKSYREEKLITVETSAIKMYLLNNSIEHIPIDTYERPKYYEEDIAYMLNRITRDKTQSDTRSMCDLIDNHMNLVSKYGFQYLNSRHNDDFINKYKQFKQLILNCLNEDRLHQIDKLENEVLEKREDKMLSNIYQHNEKHQFSQGLFFIGSGHRQSILQKIEKYNIVEKTKLNWISHDPEVNE